MLSRAREYAGISDQRIISELSKNPKRAIDGLIVSEAKFQAKISTLLSEAAHFLLDY